MENKYSSAKPFSKCFGLSEKFVRNEIHEGKVPGIYSGNRFLINVDEYLRILKQRSLEGIEGE